MHAAVLFVIALITLSAPARAESPPRRKIQLDLQQNGLLPSCELDQRLRSALVRRLGYDPIDPTAAEHLDIRVFRVTSREIAAHMELRGTDGGIIWQRFYGQLPPNGGAELVNSTTLGLELAFIRAAQRSPEPGWLTIQVALMPWRIMPAMTSTQGGMSETVVLKISEPALHEASVNVASRARHVPVAVWVQVHSVRSRPSSRSE